MALAGVLVLGQQHCEQPPQPCSIQQQSTAIPSGAVVLTSAFIDPVCHQPCLANYDWMLAYYTSAQSSCPRGRPTCRASSQRSYTVSTTLCHGVCGHMLNSALNHSPGGNARPVQSRHTFVRGARQHILVHLTTTTTSVVVWAVHRCNAE